MIRYDTVVLTFIVSTVEGTVLRARRIIGAERRVPCVAGVAVGRSRGRVQPALMVNMS
jgi:hypothetical protein